MQKVIFFFLTLPYFFAFYSFKFLCLFFANAEVWYRHSFGTLYFVPAKSDLDLSVCVGSKKSEARVLLFYKVFKVIFPFLGELALFTPAKISFMKTLNVNGFQIDRDPILKSKLVDSMSKPCRYGPFEASTFLIWTLHSDYKNLAHRPWNRIKKWMQHYSSVTKCLQPNLQKFEEIEFYDSDIIFSILTWLIALRSELDSKQQRILRSKIRWTLDHIGNHKSLRYVGAAAEVESYLWAYFPISISAVANPFPGLTTEEILLFLTQLDWQIFETLRYPVGADSVKKYLERMTFLLKVLRPQLSEAAFDEKTKKIETLSTITY